MSVLELKVPPPVVALLIGALMWLAPADVARLAATFPARPLLAATAAFAGVLLSALAIISFRRAGTTVNPAAPDKASFLVVDGVYRFTRNPMYLALLLVLIGWAIYLGHAPGFLFPALFIGYLNRFQIEPEERVLEWKFGPAYAAYKRKVRRWL